MGDRNWYTKFDSRYNKSDKKEDDELTEINGRKNPHHAINRHVRCAKEIERTKKRIKVFKKTIKK